MPLVDAPGDVETGSDKEAPRPPPSAAAPSTLTAGSINLMAVGISAFLQPPQGSPPFLFQTFFMSIVSAMLLSFVPLVLDRFLRQPFCARQHSTLNLPVCITFLESMACCFLLIAFLSAAFILQIGHANGEGILDFFPTLLLLLLLVMSFWWAFRIAVYYSPAGSRSTATAHMDAPPDL